MRNEIRFTLKKMVKSTNTGEAGLSLEVQYGRMLEKLLQKRALQSVAEILRKTVLLKRRHIYSMNAYLTLQCAQRALRP